MQYILYLLLLTTSLYLDVKAQEPVNAITEQPVTGHTNQLIVKYKENSALQRKNASANTVTVEPLPYEMSIDDAKVYAKYLAESSSDIDYVEPDQPVYLSAIPNQPNDDEYALQCQYKTPDESAYGALDVELAWQKATGSKNITLAVIDTGMADHDDLLERFPNATITGYDFVRKTAMANDGDGRDADPHDPGDWIDEQDQQTDELSHCPSVNSSWHGTKMAGAMAANANNQKGIAGIDWQSNLLVVRALGKCGGYVSDVSDAIRWAAGDTIDGVTNPTPANIINISFTGNGACGKTFQSAIDYAYNKGVIVVTSSGNQSQDAKGYFPSNCNHVISVGALNNDGSKASFSNYGDHVDFYAPGTNISVTSVDSFKQVNDDYRYSKSRGSSVAAAQASGIIALMLSANLKALQHENTFEFISEKLKKSSRNIQQGSSLCDGQACNGQLLNAYGAVLSVSTPPIAHAGADKQVNPKQVVALLGHESRDDPNGNIVSYQWRQTQGDPVILLNDQSMNTSFTAPENSTQHSLFLTFELTVTDDSRLLAQDTVTVEVLPEGQAPHDLPVFSINTRAALDDWVESEPQVLGSIQGEATLRIEGGEYKLNAGEYTQQEGVIKQGDTLIIRHKAADTVAQPRQTTLYMGELSTSFSSLTWPDNASFGLKAFNESGGALAISQTSSNNPKTLVGGMNSLIVLLMGLLGFTHYIRRRY